MRWDRPDPRLSWGSRDGPKTHGHGHWRPPGPAAFRQQSQQPALQDVFDDEQQPEGGTTEDVGRTPLVRPSRFGETCQGSLGTEGCLYKPIQRPAASLGSHHKYSIHMPHKLWAVAVLCTVHDTEHTWSSKFRSRYAKAKAVAQILATCCREKHGITQSVFPHNAKTTSPQTSNLSNSLTRSGSLTPL